jgi:zinc protease
MEGKVQSDIIWAVHGLKRNAPDYYAAMVGNVILGRLGMGGRLGENVREQQGMAYSIGSSLDADIEAGPWLAAAGVSPANIERAVQTIIHEVEQFKQDGPTDQELADAQAYLTGSLVLGLETNSGVASMLLNIERYNLGMDYVARFSDIINRLHREEITETVAKYLSTEHYVVATAGPPHNAA